MKTKKNFVLHSGIFLHLFHVLKVIPRNAMAHVMLHFHANGYLHLSNSVLLYSRDSRFLDETRYLVPNRHNAPRP